MAESNTPDGSGAQREPSKKSKNTAYLMWLLLGGLGAHRFYLSRYRSGFAYIVLWEVVVFTLYTGRGTLAAIALLAIANWWILDAFLIRGMLERRGTKEGADG